MNLIAFVGFQGSGKDTAGKYLYNSYNFKNFSFAESIKDSISSIFCWQRELLEGDSSESREWRETVDPWWSNKLNIPNFTPRWAMRHFGTELMRDHFNSDIWTLNIERKLTLLKPEDNVAVTDGRFPNEIALIRQFKGRVIRIKRGDEPMWYSVAEKANNDDMASKDLMDNVHKVHYSEWAWIGQKFDNVIPNDGTKEQFHENVVKHVFNGELNV